MGALVGSFFNVLVAIGGIIGLVVGLIQLHRWYWADVKNTLRSFVNTA